MAETLLACPFCSMPFEIKSNRDWHKVVHPQNEECLLDLQDWSYPATEEGMCQLIKDVNSRHDHRKPELCQHFLKMETCENGQVECNYEFIMEPEYGKGSIGLRKEMCPCAAWTPKGEEGK